MYKPPRGKSTGSGGWKGGKKFGEKKPWERGTNGRSSGKPFLHKAMCDACGKACQVPFVPNGSKPVLCSFCFNKDEQVKPRRSGGFGQERASGQMDNSNVQEQLRSLNVKLDTILRILNSQE